MGFGSYLNDPLPLSSTLALAILPQLALPLFFKCVAIQEAKGVGLTFLNFHEVVSMKGENQASMILAVMATTTIVSFMLYLYLDQTLPHTLGKRLPWHFFIKKDYWFPELSKSMQRRRPT